MIFTQENHIIPVLAPVADAFAGTLNTDIVSMKNAEHVTFVAWWGAGATGTTVITVDACSTVGAAATTAIAFNYKRLAGAADPVTEDTWGALTAATSSGFTTTAGSYQMYAIEIDAAVVQATGYEFVRLTCTEDTDSALLGGVFAILSGLRYKSDVHMESIS